MQPLDGLSAFIVNPDIASRARLREVLKTAVYRINLGWAQSLKEAVEKLQLMTSCDVVLISLRVGEDGVREYIGAVKGARPNPPMFVVTLEGLNHDMVTKVSSLYLDGVAGFITEPYSANDLVSLLSAVKNKGDDIDIIQKQKRAMQFLFQESIRCIDILCRCHVMGKKLPAAVTKQVQDLSASAKSLYEQNPQLYAETITEVFEKVEPKKNLVQMARRNERKIAEHPGKIISDIMTERKLTVERLQITLKTDVKEFQEFLECKRPLDEPLSRELSRLFGRTSREWLKLQKDYDVQNPTKESAKETAKN